jgi:hypothetical protein
MIEMFRYFLYTTVSWSTLCAHLGTPRAIGYEFENVFPDLVAADEMSTAEPPRPDGEKAARPFPSFSRPAISRLTFSTRSVDFDGNNESVTIS